MRNIVRRQFVCSNKAFTLIELLIAITILLIALIPLLGALYRIVILSDEDVLKTQAMFLAQQKAEEIRLNDNWNYLGTSQNNAAPSTPLSTHNNHNFFDSVSLRTVPTIPIIDPVNRRLAYCFTGSSIVYDHSTPEGADGISRILIINPAITDPTQITRKDVFYELRFYQPPESTQSDDPDAPTPIHW
jgi:prepilin-type N-terminal cleavage/methylation domain-containing protein